MDNINKFTNREQPAHWIWCSEGEVKAKKCTKKRDASPKLLFCQSNPIAFLPLPFPFPLPSPSPSSLLQFSNGPYGEASLERGTFFRSEIYGNGRDLLKYIKG